MGTIVAVIVPMVILGIVINGLVGHTFAAPAQDSEHPPTDPKIVQLVHYLTYLLDYIIRNYVPDWTLNTPQNATSYFEKAFLISSNQNNEPRRDSSKRPAKPDDVTAEKTIRVVDQLSHEAKL